MAKALKTIGTAIVFAGAVVATGGVALAMSAGVGIGGALGLASGTLASMGGLSITASGLVKVGLLTSAVASSLDRPKVQSSGAAIEWAADPDAPMHFAAGRIGVAGQIVHCRVFGPDNMFVGFVNVVSGAGPIRRFVRFKADDAVVTFDASGKADSSYHANVMWRRTQLGAQPEPSALTSPSGLKNGASLPDWGSAYRLSGKAAFMYTLAENSKQSAYRGKVPTGLNVIEGLFGWDPRQDSTWPGGSGPCRLNDPSTWVWIDNPILWALKWSLGLWEGPTGKGAPQVDYQVGGIGAKVEGIHVASFVEAANVADARGWKVAAWPSTDDSKASVLDSFLQAGGAIYAEKAGKIACVHRAAPRPSIVTITGADTAGPLEIDTATSRINRINTIRPRFWSEAHDWQMTATDEVTAEAYQIEDGQGVAVKRTRGIDFNYVPEAKQAGELSRLQIANTREGIQGVIPLRPYMQGLEIGDCITITEPDFVLDGLKCLVLNVDDETEADVIRVSFVSETDTKYPWAFGEVTNPPPPQTLVPSDPTYVSPPNPKDWVIIPRMPGEDGIQVPIIDIEGEVSNATATAVLVEWGYPPDPPAPDPLPTAPEGERQPVFADYVNWQSAGTWPVTATGITLNGIQPGATYYVAFSYVRGQNVSERALQGPRVAPGLVAGDVVPTAPALRPLLDGLGRVPGLLEDQWKNAINILEEVISRREIDRTDREAAIKRDDVIGNDLVRTKETLEVAVNGTVALIETERQARITAISAEATTRNNQVVALGQSIAGVESSVSTVATNLSAETNLRTLQYSQTTTSMAVIDTLSQTTATALSAETSTRQTQISSLNGNLSVVDLRSQTNVTNLQALSSTTNTLSTDFQGFKALATNDIQLLSTASSAQGSQLNLLAVTVGQNGAAITSLNTALVTESHSRVTGDSSLQALYNGVSSTVSIQQTAIAGLEAQNNLARFDLTVAAGGGRPALFSMISTVAGSALALKGDQIWLGDHTYFDDVPAVFRTLTGGGRQRVWGGLFGSAGEMLDWLGPVTVPIGQMSRTNADFFLAASEPRIGGNSFPVSGSSGGYKALEAVMGLSGAYGLVASASLASAVSGSLMSMEVTGVGGTYGSPSASGMVMFKVTAQAATGGLEYPIGEASVTATSSGLSLPGGTFTVDWVGTAIGSLVVPLSGPVVIRLYARLYTGTAPTNATGSAVVTITPPAS